MPERHSHLYGADFVKGVPQGSYPLLVPEFLCSTWQPVSSPRPAHPHCRRAQKRSRMGAALAPTEGSSLRASSTTAHLSVSGMTTSEGSCGLVHEASCHILVCGGPKAQTMMQGYASAASSEAADPFLPTALKPSGSAGHRHLEPSSATRQKRATGAETVRCSLTASSFSVPDG